MPEEEPEEGEAWMASFADLMSLLMAFFVLLYSMSTMDVKKFFEYGKSISKSFQASEVKPDKAVRDIKTEELRRIRALQMLIAILNLGEENDAIKKVEKVYQDKLKKENGKIFKRRTRRNRRHQSGV